MVFGEGGKTRNVVLPAGIHREEVSALRNGEYPASPAFKPHKKDAHLDGLAGQEDGEPDRQGRGSRARSGPHG